MAEQNIVIIIHAAPHGSERCLSGLRVAGALAARDDVKRLRILLMSDAAVAALPHQKDNAGNVIETLVTELASADNASVHLCSKCAEARGLIGLPHIAGVTLTSMIEVAGWIVEADKVLTF